MTSLKFMRSHCFHGYEAFSFTKMPQEGNKSSLLSRVRLTRRSTEHYCFFWLDMDLGIHRGIYCQHYCFFWLETFVLPFYLQYVWKEIMSVRLSFKGHVLIAMVPNSTEKQQQPLWSFLPVDWWVVTHAARRPLSSIPCYPSIRTCSIINS